MYMGQNEVSFQALLVSNSAGGGLFRGAIGTGSRRFARGRNRSTTQSPVARSIRTGPPRRFLQLFGDWGLTPSEATMRLTRAAASCGSDCTR